MKITDIKQQVKRADRYSIFVDEKYSFSLSELALLNSGLRIGKELSTDELEALKDTSKRDKAYNRTLSLLARRARSEWEIRDYLKRKDYEPEVTDEIVKRLYGNNLLDDVSFARMWVDNRRLLKKTSRRRLMQELKQKRISEDIIGQVLEEDETDEVLVLRQLIERKRTQTRYQDEQKLMQYLIRQGFSYGDVKEALSPESSQ